MKYFNDDIDPKKFSSYDEYLEALRANEQFREKAEAVDKLFEETKSEEEYIKGMEDLGFSYVDDDYCEQTWCSKNGKCLKVEIEIFQDEFNEMFFDGLLSKKDEIVTDKMLKDNHEIACGLPESWHKQASKERNAILFLFALGEILFFNEKVFSKKFLKGSDVQSFGRNCLLFIQAVLHRKTLNEKWVTEIRGFSKKNKLFSDIENAKLIKLLKKIIDF